MDRNLSTTNDLIVGNNGRGSFTAASLAGVTLTDDLIVGNNIDGSGTIVIDDFGTVLDAGDDVVIGSGGTGVMQVTNGGRVRADATTIGFNAISDGRVTVTGANSLWKQTGQLTIGDIGRGSLTVSNQGRVEAVVVVVGNAAGGNGTVEVSGVGSVLDVTGVFNAGSSGNATVTVSSGGRLSVSGSSTIGLSAATDTRATITGAGSLFKVSSLTVGNGALGTLSILAGGRVTATNTVGMGTNTPGRAIVLVDGAGSTLESVNAGMDVGINGNAVLTIANGGIVDSGGTCSVGQHGQIILAGGRFDSVGSVTNLGIIRGDGQINAAITNTSSGEIRVGAGDELDIIPAVSNSGLISLDGGDLTFEAAVTNNSFVSAARGSIHFRGGFSNTVGSQLALVGGSVDVYGSISNVPGATIVVGGATHSILHGGLNNTGQVIVAKNSDLLVLTNLAFTPTSLLRLELVPQDVPTPPVSVSAGVGLAGALDLVSLGGFDPAYLVPQRIITGSSRSGIFANVSGISLNPNKSLAVTYDGGGVFITAAVPGDANLSGIVGFEDLVTLAQHYNDPAIQTWSTADFTGNGNVGFDDLVVLAQHYGAVAPTDGELGTLGNAFAADWALAQSLAPEPASLALLGFGIALGRRRRG